MNKVTLIALFLLAILGIFWYNNRPSGMDSEPEVEQKITPSITPSPITKINTTTPIMEQKNYSKAVISTNMGDFTITFKTIGTKKTVENFVKLASTGFYDGTRFHRVIKGFMIQGGDPLSKDLAMKNRWGTGGPGYQFADEIGPDNSNDVGTIAMANAGPNTNGSQFFVNVVNNTHLNKGHTVFGKVTSGLDVIQKISTTKTDTTDKPLTDVIIKSITLE